LITLIVDARRGPCGTGLPSTGDYLKTSFFEICPIAGG
jgi:hypothetical protein